jgi:hypothetical protein
VRRALLLALAAVLLPAAPAHAACRPSGSTVVARHGQIALYETSTDSADRVYACVPHRPRVVLQDFSPDLYPTFSGLRFAGHYAAFAETIGDINCGKYDPGNPLCVTYRVASYNLWTGHRRALAQAQAASLVLVPRGWIAWTERGIVTVVRAFDSLGPSTLDSGLIPPASLTSHGSLVSWSNDGARRAVRLRTRR